MDPHPASVLPQSYLAKADEDLAAAQDELEASRGIAATSLAIHAINAADAGCSRRLGKRATGQDHDQVVGLLTEVGKGRRQSHKRPSSPAPDEDDGGDTSPMTSSLGRHPNPERAQRCV